MIKMYSGLKFVALLSLAAGLVTVPACNEEAPGKLPNIIYILADDLGYGDVSAFNPESAWKTVHIDRIASEGMMFTDAHTGSAVCSPTRYGILTGRYAWRTRLKKQVLWSWDEPLIEESEMTAGKLLQEHGYATGCIGKWHLGLGWQYHEGYPDSVDFSKPVWGGPSSLGFNYFFGITASLDIPPYVWIENDRSTTVPVKYTESSSEMGWWRSGLTGSDFEHEQVMPVLTQKAVAFIDQQAEKGKDQPFFLYFPLPAPHTPILPVDDFKGKSGTNPYGDFMLQVDWTVGEILKALDRNGIRDETLIIFTSDNGCSPQADFDRLAEYGHDPSYLFRGTKADIFEGGHHVPFAVRWPGVVSPGSHCGQVTCLTDLLATLADIVNDTLDPSDGVDSYSLLPAFHGITESPIREATIHHSINGSFSIRKGKWKLNMCPGSGGWSDPKPGSPEVAELPPFQLYDLSSDIGETLNLAEQYPEIVTGLRDLLENYIVNGRSTPGEPQENVRTKSWPGIEWLPQEVKQKLILQ